MLYFEALKALQTLFSFF